MAVMQVADLLLALAEHAGIGRVHLVRRETVQSLMQSFRLLDATLMVVLLQYFELLSADPEIQQPLQVCRVLRTCRC